MSRLDKDWGAFMAAKDRADAAHDATHPASDGEEHGHVLPPMTVNPVTPWSPPEPCEQACMPPNLHVTGCNNRKGPVIRPPEAEEMDGDGTFGTGYDATRP